MTGRILTARAVTAYLDFVVIATRHEEWLGRVEVNTTDGT